MMIAGEEVDALQFIEGGLGYRLPWAMEALRVRAAANGDTVGMPALALEDYELGLAVPAVETGTMNRSASILIQAGFNSRQAAIKAVTDTAANFTNGAELRDWLRSPGLAVYSAQPNWPTAEARPYGSNSSRNLLRQTTFLGRGEIILETSIGSMFRRLPELQSVSFIGTDNR